MMSLTDLPRLTNALQSGSLTLADYLDRLEAHFASQEPAVMAFVPEENRFGRLRQEAQALEARYPEPATRPPLFGLAVGVKDIFRVDGFATQAGSQLPAARLNGRQASSVTRLRQAGALILGKTVTTEFAYFAPGPTRNPNNLAHTPGGSSSGSAAAVAAGLAPLTLGTQTIGSLNRPAAFCGVVGFKPSYERISRAGVIPLSASLDHVGFFTADVNGAELAASVLCPHWQLAVTQRKPVLGIPAGAYLDSVSAEGMAFFQAACRKLAAAGYVIQSLPAMPDFEAIVARHNLIVAAEAAQTHARWFAEFSQLYHPKTADLIRRGQQVNVQELKQALSGRVALRQQLTHLMDNYGLDLWLSPAAVGPAPQGLNSTGDPIMNLPWTHSGLPTLTVPAGRNQDNLPLGLQLTARWYMDEALLSWAAEIEPIVGSYE